MGSSFLSRTVTTTLASVERGVAPGLPLSVTRTVRSYEGRASKSISAPVATTICPEPGVGSKANALPKFPATIVYSNAVPASTSVPTSTSPTVSPGSAFSLIAREASGSTGSSLRSVTLSTIVHELESGGVWSSFASIVRSYWAFVS